MSHYAFPFCGETLHALPSGALFWPTRGLLCVSDLHFGKAQRYAATGGVALPPYETQDTLLRLEKDICASGASTVICLGDSFDRRAASDELDSAARDWITRLQAGRRWIWIEGNHDPGPLSIAGTHRAEHKAGPLVFRHIAAEQAQGEVSGHYHPKLTLTLGKTKITRRCLLIDANRIILPAFGTYTGGLSVQSPPLRTLMKEPVLCVLSDGRTALPVPRPPR